MKFDFMKIMNVIGIAMAAVQKIKGAAGKDKEAAVIETVNEVLPEVEGALGLDFVNDEALRSVLANYIAARKALAAAIAAAKQLKPAQA